MYGGSNGKISPWDIPMLWVVWQVLFGRFIKKASLKRLGKRVPLAQPLELHILVQKQWLTAVEAKLREVSRGFWDIIPG